MQFSKRPDYCESTYLNNIMRENRTLRSCPILETTNAAVDPVPSPSTIPLSTYSTACSSKHNEEQKCIGITRQSIFKTREWAIQKVTSCLCGRYEKQKQIKNNAVNLQTRERAIQTAQVHEKLHMQYTKLETPNHRIVQHINETILN